MPRFAFFTFLAAAVLSGSAFAQNYTAQHIVFKDPGPFTQAQLEQVSGMHPGVVANTTIMNAAATKLQDTGYFDEVSAYLEGKSATDVTLYFNLKPTDRATMLHVGFENFVWLTHDEIEAEIHAKLPLFFDYLPESSPSGDVITAALREALSAKGIKATVESETVEPTLTHPERTLEYRITTPDIRVINVKLAGVSTPLVPFVQKSVNTVGRTPYNAGLSGTITAERILEPLLDAGYVQATLSDVALTPGAPVNMQVSPGAPVKEVVPVVVSASLSAGEVYRVSEISYRGSPLVSAAAFGSSQKLHAGDTASRKLLLESLEPVDAAYRRQGYMDVVVRARPTFDNTAHTVAYEITVVPGSQYKVHQVLAENLDGPAQAAFEKNFSMKAGELYNPEYVRNFLVKNTAIKELQGYVASYKAYADPNAHTVDVVLTFAKMR